MAQQAERRQSNAAIDYNFSRFEVEQQPNIEPRRHLRVAPVTRTAQQAQRRRMVGVLAAVLLLASLGAMVISTYARLGELQSEINRQNTELTNQRATYTDLEFQLESKTNLNQVEQRAIEMGFVKVEKSQVTYIRVVEENQIEVQKGPLQQLWEAIAQLFSGAEHA